MRKESIKPITLYAITFNTSRALKITNVAKRSQPNPPICKYLQRHFNDVNYKIYKERLKRLNKLIPHELSSINKTIDIKNLNIKLSCIKKIESYPKNNSTNIILSGICLQYSNIRKNQGEA